MSAILVRDDDRGRSAAIEALRTGAIVALPTDTVYGLAVGLDTPGGIERLFHVKHRPPEKGIVLLLDDAAQAALLGDMSLAAEALAAALWPGGLTIVVRRRTDVGLPDALTGGAATIGLRVPDHDAPRALARALGPLPVTSANVSGAPEARDAAEIQAILGDAIELILDGGPARGGPPSTVVDCSIDEPRILRPGAIDAARLAAALDAVGIRHAFGHPVVGTRLTAELGQGGSCSWEDTSGVPADRGTGRKESAPDDHLPGERDRDGVDRGRRPGALGGDAGGASSAARQDRAHRERELRLRRRDGGAGQLADQQVRRGPARQALLRRLRVRGHRRAAGPGARARPVPGRRARQRAAPFRGAGQHDRLLQRARAG